MPFYRRVGDVPRKRHVRVEHPSGDGFLHEELMGITGFSGESSLLYHLHSPSAIVSVESVDDPSLVTFTQDSPLLPRHLLTSKLERGGDLVLGRKRLLGNEDVVISWVCADRTSELYRNADGYELLYVQAGTATLESSFGNLDVRDGDYVVIPTGTTHRWCVREGDPVSVLVFEVAGHLQFPQKYLSDKGQLLEGAPFTERDLRSPDDPANADGSDVPVLVRSSTGLTRHVHAHHPFDVVGWDGCLYPHVLSIHDFEPIVGALHQPPPVHQTFAGPNLVICSFVPRPFDFHPQAIKVPYHHANVDSDEVIFYSAGDFMSRASSGVGEGSISMHPAGFVHGPQPGSMERAIDATRTEELAVMADTFHRLGLSDLAREIADGDYAWTWAGRRL